MEGRMTDKPETKPKRTSVYIEDHDNLADWIDEYKATAKDKYGLTLTSRQCFDAFLKVAFESLGQTEDDGRPLGTGEL
jgi:hypothetical protein